MLEVVDLHKRYGTVVALQKVSFHVAPGEMFGLLGPNGAGKTTLLSIISCLLEPTAGEVRILGRKVQTRDRELRHWFGIVPQEVALYGELTARENLVFFGNLYGLAGDELKRRADVILDTIGLQDRADHRVETFSGGMKRRLNLGAALVHQPKLLLLDEPTTGVDPQSRNHLFDGIRRFNDAATTNVYTSHYMEEVQTLCPRIGIIDHGKLIACDTLAHLLNQLPGTIRFRVSQPLTPNIREKLRLLPDAVLVEETGKPIELRSQDTKASLLRLVALLNESKIELTSLEMEEPNLERVFLHLTGRALRD